MSFLTTKTVGGLTSVLSTTEEPGNTLTTTRVTITATSGQLVAANSARLSLCISNLSTTNTIYIKGAAGATAAANFPIPPLATLNDIRYKGVIHAVTASGSADIAILEEVA